MYIAMNHFRVEAARRMRWRRRVSSAVNDAQGELDKAVQNAQSLEVQATAAQHRWEDSQRRLQANGSSNQTGTGSGK